MKARLGTKAAKSHERLESVGDELEGEAATMFRALPARYLDLSMDRRQYIDGRAYISIGARV